jgi:hypothetical protein
MDEWFRREHVPDRPCPIHGRDSKERVPSRNAASEDDVARLLKPTEGLHLAMDPRPTCSSRGRSCEARIPRTRVCRYPTRARPSIRSASGSWSSRQNGGNLHEALRATPQPDVRDPAPPLARDVRSPSAYRPARGGCG